MSNETLKSPLLTDPEAARYLRRSVRSLYDLRRGGKIRYVQDGGRIFYTRAALDDFITQNEKSGPTR